MCSACLERKYWPVFYSQFFPIHAAEDVLDGFRQRFIDEMDAKVVALDLKHKDIISDGDVVTIHEMKDKMQQNQFLHGHIKAKCTTEALMKVCDAIISVRGNPKMKKLGKDMKYDLAGKPYYVCSINQSKDVSLQCWRSSIHVPMCSIDNSNM